MCQSEKVKRDISNISLKKPSSINVTQIHVIYSKDYIFDNGIVYVHEFSYCHISPYMNVHFS